MTAAGTAWWPRKNWHAGIRRRIRQGRRRRPRTAASTRRRSIATTQRSRRCSKRFCRAAPATCWRSAAAPASTPSRSPQQTAFGHLVADRLQRQSSAQHRGLARRTRKLDKRAGPGPPRRQRGRLAAAPRSACPRSSRRYSAPTSSTSRRGRWRKGCSPAPARHLVAGGRLFLYGPFRRDGAHNAPSNAAFDESLRSRNPEWGVRDTADLRTARRRERASFRRACRDAVEQRHSDVRTVALVIPRGRAKLANPGIHNPCIQSSAQGLSDSGSLLRGVRNDAERFCPLARLEQARTASSPCPS